MRVALITALGLLNACGGARPGPEPQLPPALAALHTRCRALEPLHRRLAALQANDWLAQHDEPGQTFAEYVTGDPIRPDEQRRKIYVVPIGTFDAARRAVLDATVDGTRIWFGLETVVTDVVPLTDIPDFARREFPHGGWLQLQTTYIIDEVLRARLPNDAACMIAFCADDLWPGRGWNFVFGQASLNHRVGVWSIFRNGDPNDGDAARRLCLLRTLKTATHEIGHMFGLWHCIAWECNMCGSNHREESDRHPLWLSPECLPKVLWCTGTEPVARARELAEFCGQRGLEVEAAYFGAAADLLSR